MRSSVLALAMALALPAAAAEPPSSLPAHYVVFQVDEAGFRPLAHRSVRVAGLKPSLAAEALAAALETGDAEHERVGVELLDAAGAVVYRTVAEVPRWIRNEAGLFDAEAVAEPVRVPLADRAFVVRVPAHGRSLRLRRAGVETSAVFDLQALAADAALPLAGFRVPGRLTAAPTGGPANRLDILVMGDGYRAVDAALFDANADAISTSFLAIAPYAQYTSHTNLLKLFTASPEAGADHPPYSAGCPNPPACCADPAAQGDPRAGTFVATAFDAMFCTSNIHRLLTVSTGKVLTAAAAVPDWDEILVIVNDPVYGGAGGSFSVFSMHAAAVDVARHEFGHSFSRLADEYETPFPGYPACSDIGGPACQPNVTDDTSRASIKWGPWVLAQTPLPTPETQEYATVVGAFEGARYLPTVMHRPRQSCLMRSLGVSFCPVCSQSFVLRLYDGGWGVPGNGIDPIEPGSESPAPGPVNLTFPGTLSLQNALVPTSGGLSSRWTVNGARIAGAGGGALVFTPAAVGTYDLRLEVSDPTPMVHPAMAGASLTSSRQWTVSVTGGGPGIAVGAITPDSGPAAGGTVVTLTGGGFQAGTGVTIGGQVAGPVLVVNDTTIQATTPALAAGALYAVAVSKPGHQHSLAAAWLADFTDVPASDVFHDFVEKLVRNQIVAGCGGGAYCRDTAVTRAQMAVFLLSGRYGSGYRPPAATGTVFADVPANGFAAAWIEDLARRATTGGCGGGNYCPNDAVTRAQMAVFLLRTKYHLTYLPPPATGMFDDVPANNAFAPWIEQLAREGITGGCGGGNYCPDSPVTRGQMAVFLSAALGLP